MAKANLESVRMSKQHVPTARDRMIQDIEAFLVEHGMRPTIFGKLALNDPALMGSLRQGRDLKLETADKIRRFMASYKQPRRKPRPRGNPVRAAA